MSDHFSDNHNTAATTATTTNITIPRPDKQYRTTFSLPHLFSQLPCTRFLQRFPSLILARSQQFRIRPFISSKADGIVITVSKAQNAQPFHSATPEPTLSLPTTLEYFAYVAKLELMTAFFTQDTRVIKGDRKFWLIELPPARPH